jgi:hypothetical protein
MGGAAALGQVEGHILSSRWLDQKIAGAFISSIQAPLGWCEESQTLVFKLVAIPS